MVGRYVYGLYTLAVCPRGQMPIILPRLAGRRAPSLEDLKVITQVTESVLTVLAYTWVLHLAVLSPLASSVFLRGGGTRLSCPSRRLQAPLNSPAASPEHLVDASSNLPPNMTIPSRRVPADMHLPPPPMSSINSPLPLPTSQNQSSPKCLSLQSTAASARPQISGHSGPFPPPLSSSPASPFCGGTPAAWPLVSVAHQRRPWPLWLG